MIKRKYLDEMQELASFSPVIGLIGPRQVGKTTLAKEFIKKVEKDCIYIDLEKPSDYEKMNESEYYFKLHIDKCIVIDEIQIRPELFAIMRAAVDDNRVPLRFVVLGSASPDIIWDSSESLAGRISYIQMMPFSLTEVDGDYWRKHHFLGGFPESYLASSEKQSRTWLDNFIKTYIERDLPMLGLSASHLMIRRLWEMLAWQNGNLLNATAIGNSLGLSNHSIRRYIDFLEGAFMVRSLEPFAANIKKRIVKSPKIFISDTGLLHRLLRINSYDELLGMPVLGASFEAYVLQQILAEKSTDLEVFFYRTHAGTEIDFVLAKAMKPVACIEVKYSSAPKISKSLMIGIEDLKTSNNYIVVPDSELFNKTHHITVCGINGFIKHILPAL
jgi:uncharacterized protein